MENLRIVLVEPAGALNVGAAARVMQNMGLQNLVLVSPRCDWQGPQARLLAVRGTILLEQARVVSSLAEAVAGCQRVLGTAGRLDGGDRPVLGPAAGLAWVLAAPQGAVVFGREDRGLSNAELRHCQQLLTIPTDPAYPSLNLAQAVAICGYQARQLTIANPDPGDRGSQGASDLLHCAPVETMADFYQELEALLLAAGYLYPHTAFRRMEKLRQLGDRLAPTVEEASLLRGIVRQLTWAVRHSSGAERRGEGTQN
ncbi:MAG: RNA methyltransferase [Oscillatoriales cyanobacterium SM2_1_8]|nr:RNA methyltransferase [Oscillatoriales cyanobacterium SM2_1_8]